MTLRPEVIRERLQHLRQAVRNLRELEDIPREEFVASFRHYWLAERGLQLAAEALLDSGNHLLVAHFNVNPADYEDVITQLGEQGVLSPALRDRLRGLGGFRNVLVHGYLAIDRGRVYDALHHELQDLIVYADELEAFLERIEAAES